MKKVRQLLRSLSEAPLQAYLDNRVQLFDIIEMILRETGPAEIYISTFSTSEEFLRRIYRLKRRGQLIRAYNHRMPAGWHDTSCPLHQAASGIRNGHKPAPTPCPSAAQTTL